MAPPARLANGRYEVRATLGEGAQGVTYDAIDLREGQPVAIKRFDVRGARAWKDVELAERETRVLRALDHPLVPRYIDHFEEDGALYLVMAKIEGETLDAIIRREGRLPEIEVQRFLADADRALTYLHGRSSPVVHRDIKPRNVIRRTNGSYVFVDFGAVSELMHRRGSSTVVGTLGYMAPEQLQGRAMPATDVYAVGATALAALTGKEPETLPHKGLRIDVRAALENTASPALAGALAHMVEPDPDRRAASLAIALDGVRTAIATSGPPPSTPTGHRNVRDRRWHGVTREDAAVKSIRNLLWLLWGLGWVIVPVVFAQLHIGRLIPTVMFGSLAALFVVTWHKGAVLRAILRRFGVTDAFSDNAPHRARIEVESDRKVRVHASDHPPAELEDATDIEHAETVRRRARRG